MSTKEKKPRRSLDQDFIDTPMVRSAVLLVGQAMLGNGGGRCNIGSNCSYPDRSANPTAKSPGRDDREIATIDHETKRKNPWIRKETKGFRQSGRRDSNPRPLPPQGSALARLRYGPMFRRFQQQTCRLIAPVDRLVKQPRV